MNSSVEYNQQPPCFRCGGPSPKDARFCPQCGARLLSNKLGIKFFVTVVLTAGLVYVSAIFLQPQLIGTRPTANFQQTASKAPGSQAGTSALPPEAPNLEGASVETLQTSAQTLLREISESESPSSERILETVDVLRRLLALEPTNAIALLGLADISFNQRLFDKSVEYYTKYLEVNKDDLDVRARFASSLAFVGRATEAEKTLKEIIDTNPKHFHAHAYYAIVLAQLGKKSQSLEAGKQALNLAPNAQAKERFAQFLATIDSAAIPNPSPTDSSKDPFVVQFIKDNPIAGPKFDHFEKRGNIMEIYMDGFPIEAMPDTVRGNFLRKLKDQAQKDQGITTLLLIDKESGKVLVEVKKLNG